MTMGRRLVFGIAGRIGSGKSEVGYCIRDGFGFQYLRYSLVLSEWHHADPEAKDQLQKVGWDVMLGDKQRELNRRVIAKIDETRDYAIDGLRHPIDYESLWAAFSHNFLLIFVDTPAEIRFERLRGRFGTRQAFDAADSHPVESKIDLLKPMAAAVLRGERPLQELKPEIAKLVEMARAGRAV